MILTAKQTNVSHARVLPPSADTKHTRKLLAAQATAVSSACVPCLATAITEGLYMPRQTPQPTWHRVRSIHSCLTLSCHEVGASCRMYATCLPDDKLCWSVYYNAYVCRLQPADSQGVVAAAHCCSRRVTG